MIDIHSHILPGIDDGAKTVEDALAMARFAANEGITKIIATPHHQNQQFDNVKQSIVHHVASLNEHLKEAHIPVTILPGQEVRIYGEILADYHKGEILTLNDTKKYLFIELPSGHVPRYTEKLLYDLQLQNLIPIIVHPERNREIIENPDILYQFVKKGALTQVTAGSITGEFGKKIKTFSLKLIEANLTHFIASDAHNLTNRTFRLRDAYRLVEKKFGIEMVYLIQENAELLVNGQTVNKEIPERMKKRKLFGII